MSRGWRKKIYFLKEGKLEGGTGLLKTYKIIVPLYALVVCTVSFYLTVKFLIAFWMHCVCTGNPQSVVVFITLFGIEAGIMAYLSWLCDWLYSKPLYKIISELLGKVICRIRHV